MGLTFGSSDDGFDLVEEGHYAFQLMTIHPPQVEPNPFFDAYCNENPDYDRDNDPLGKRERSNIAMDVVVLGRGEFAGSRVRVYSGSKPGNEMGNPQYPTKLRTISEAILGRKLEKGETVDSDDIINGTFGATVVHKAKRDGGIKVVLEGYVKYKRKNQPAPVEPVVEDDDVDDEPVVAAPAPAKTRRPAPAQPVVEYDDEEDFPDDEATG